MAIIVTNLLVGLAVDDIKSVQEQAILKRLAMQVCVDACMRDTLRVCWCVYMWLSVVCLCVFLCIILKS